VKRTYQGRPISVDFHSTPQLYAAIFTNEYCGCEECRGKQPIGFGRTEDAAVAALIEQEQENDDAEPFTEGPDTRFTP
jgi:hypothetical protein